MKVKDIKSKVAAKVAKGKAKVAEKCGKAAKCAVVLFALAFVITGCQNPAQRAQTAEVKIVVEQGGTANFGNEFISLAQSNETGGNDAGQTASPTTDTKPEIAVGVGGSSAGVGGTSGAAKKGVGAAIGGAIDAIADVIPDSSSTEPVDNKVEEKSAPVLNEVPAETKCENCTADSASCPNGNCTRSSE